MQDGQYFIDEKRNVADHARSQPRGWQRLKPTAGISLQFISRFFTTKRISSKLGNIELKFCLNIFNTSLTFPIIFNNT